MRVREDLESEMALFKSKIQQAEYVASRASSNLSQVKLNLNTYEDLLQETMAVLIEDVELTLEVLVSMGDTVSWRPEFKKRITEAFAKAEKEIVSALRELRKEG